MHNYKLKLQANYSPGYGYGNEISARQQYCALFFLVQQEQVGATVFHLFGRHLNPIGFSGKVLRERAASQNFDKWTRNESHGGRGAVFHSL